jgi:hypothetical protein
VKIWRYAILLFPRIIEIRSDPRDPVYGPVTEDVEWDFGPHWIGDHLYYGSNKRKGHTGSSPTSEPCHLLFGNWEAHEKVLHESKAIFNPTRFDAPSSAFRVNLEVETIYFNAKWEWAENQDTQGEGQENTKDSELELVNTLFGPSPDIVT